MTTTTPSTQHPGVSFNTITELGLKALILAEPHATTLEPRLPPDTLKNLGQDLDNLGVVVPGAKQARAESMAATSAQDVVARKGYALVRAVRAAVRKARAPRDVQRAYSVGQHTNPGIVRDVQAAVGQIIDRATAQPAEAASFGVTQKDVDAMKVTLAALTEADRDQSQKKVSAPQTTRERNQTAHRILASVRLISAAGVLELAGDEVQVAAFEALKPPARHRKPHAKSDTKPAPQAEAKPAPAPAA